MNFRLVEPSPLETVLGEIESALAARLYYAALAVALTLPEICESLAHPNGSLKRESYVRYKEWYRAYMAGRVPELTDEDCYSLRCGVLHQGRLGRTGMDYARIIFTSRDHGAFMHRNILNDALNLDVATFCRDMISGARAWYDEHKDDEKVIEHLPLLFRWRPGGMAPYIVGLPVLA